MLLINRHHHRRFGKDEYKSCIRYVDGLCTFNTMQCNPENCRFLQDYLRDTGKVNRDSS